MGNGIIIQQKPGKNMVSKVTFSLKSKTIDNDHFFTHFLFWSIFMVLFRHHSIPRFCVTLQDGGSHTTHDFLVKVE